MLRCSMGATSVHFGPDAVLLEFPAMNPSQAQHFHFIGICGTAMGAVAAGMKAKGYRVTGSDAKMYEPMRSFLLNEGVEIVEGYDEVNIPASAEVIVIGNAISRGNPEAEATLERKLRYVSLPELLKEHFLAGKRNFVVSGTHGKTTTTAMLTWLFKHAQLEPSYMIGGLPKNLGRGAEFAAGALTVLEGDEYDTAFFDKRSKFLHYLPECAVINNIEFDHADIYRDVEEIKLSFKRLLLLVPRTGMAFVNGDDQHCLEVAAQAPCPVRTVGMGAMCKHRIQHIDYLEDGTRFELDGVEYATPMVGEFNVRNAAMAICAARFAGVEESAIRAALLDFAGVARRQELRGEVRGVRVIDDFAHHPTAIQLAIAALRQRYPGAKLWVLFEPRTNTTKRKVFQLELAQALASADVAVIAAMSDLHKVPENDRLDPVQLMREIKQHHGTAHYLPDVESIVTLVASEAQPGDVVAVLSNGGFGGIHQLLLQRLAGA